MKMKYLYWLGGAVVAYIVYETWIQPATQGPTLGSATTPTANPDANADMGGVDFGVLDPSNWD